MLDHIVVVWCNCLILFMIRDCRLHLSNYLYLYVNDECHCFLYMAKRKTKCVSPRNVKPLTKHEPTSAATKKEDQILVYRNEYRPMQVKRIAECSKRAFCNTFDLH